MSKRATPTVILHATGCAAPPETAVVRLVGMLPAGWRCSWRLDEGRLELCLATPDGATPPPDAVHDWLARSLADTAFSGWHEAADR